MHTKSGKTLYLGTSPSAYDGRENVVHFPVIELISRAVPFYILQDMQEFTHVVFTSKNSVTLFCSSLKDLSALKGKVICVIGKETEKRCHSLGFRVSYVAEKETQEGLVDLFFKICLENAYVLFPKSSLGRHLIESFFIEREIRNQTFNLYDTITKKPEHIIDLQQFDEIVFTSPSTVKAFLEIFNRIPQDKKLTCLGPITQDALRSV